MIGPRHLPAAAIAPTLLAAVLGAACGGDDVCTIDTTYQPAIVAADFVPDVTNPLFPLVPGTVFTYEGGGEVITVTVETARRTLMGVPAIQVHDVARVAGDIIEDTLDWYAQDRLGNVWYMGEDTKELDHGTVVSTEGSWQAGVDGALPGVLIPATPAPGPSYRQEYSPCNAEDKGEVLATDAAVTVPTGSYTACLETHDFTPLEPGVNEQKFYCPGVGLVLSVDVPTGTREELTRKTP